MYIHLEAKSLELGSVNVYHVNAKFQVVTNSTTKGDGER